MFLGQHTAKVEAKNRIFYPAKFREGSNSTLIITYGFEQSLMIVPSNEWNLLVNTWEEESILLPEVRDLELFIFGGASQVSLDPQGRFLLPAYLKEFAHIEKDVVFVGSRNYVRLWSQKTWNNYQGLLSLQIKEKARIIGERINQKGKNNGI